MMNKFVAPDKKNTNIKDSNCKLFCSCCSSTFLIDSKAVINTEPHETVGNTWAAIIVHKSLCEIFGIPILLSMEFLDYPCQCIELERKL